MANGINPWETIMAGFLGAINPRETLDVLRFLEDRRRWREEQERLERARRLEEERLRLAKQEQQLQLARQLASLGARPSDILYSLTTGEIPSIKPSEVVFSPEEIEEFMSYMPWIRGVEIVTEPARVDGKVYEPPKKPLSYEPPPAEFTPPKTMIKAEISPFKVPEEVQTAVLMKLKEQKALPQDVWYTLATGKYQPTVEEQAKDIQRKMQVARLVAERAGVPYEAVAKELGLPIDEEAYRTKQFIENVPKIQKAVYDLAKKLGLPEEMARIYSLESAVGRDIDLGVGRASVRHHERKSGPFTIGETVIYDEQGLPVGSFPEYVEFNTEEINRRLSRLGNLALTKPEMIENFLWQASQDILTAPVDLQTKKNAFSYFLSAVDTTKPGASWLFFSNLIDDKTEIGSKLKEKMRTAFLHQKPNPFSTHPDSMIESLRRIKNLSFVRIPQVDPKTGKKVGESEVPLENLFDQMSEVIENTSLSKEEKKLWKEELKKFRGRYKQALKQLDAYFDEPTNMGPFLAAINEMAMLRSDLTTVLNTITNRLITEKRSVHTPKQSKPEEDKQKNVPPITIPEIRGVW